MILIESRHLNGAAVIVADAFTDDRGYFMEVFREDFCRTLGLPPAFVQENQSGSKRKVLRGLHFQFDPPMGKLMRVTYGTAFLVAVDIRKGSPTLGKWIGLEVSAESRKQIWAPPGFARGFCALSEYCIVEYLCTGIYNPHGESGIRWDDPQIGIEWPVPDPILSEKDRKAQTLAEWLATPHSDHFRYAG